MKTYVQPGEVLEYTNGGGSTITDGTAVLVGTVLGIAMADIPVGATGSLLVRGVVTIAVDNVNSNQGTAAYWDASTSKVTNTSNSGANEEIGYFWLACVGSTGFAQVKLTG